jgi:hypothetical protein
METQISGSTNNIFRQSTTFVNEENVPSSNWNGTYLLKLKNVSKVDDSVNRRFQYIYTLTLSAMFMISAGNSLASYNNAIEDTEKIVTKRLQQTSWTSSPSIAIITLQSIDEPRFQKNTDSTYMGIDMNFEVNGFYNY